MRGKGMRPNRQISIGDFAMRPFLGNAAVVALVANMRNLDGTYAGTKVGRYLKHTRTKL